jgi:hypothetical protein
VFVTYHPEDGEKQNWTFEPGKVRAARAEMIEKRYGGGNWANWVAEVKRGSVRARRILLWHLLSLDHHTLRLEDVPDFAMDELLVEHSVAELVELRDRIAKSDTMPADEQQGVLLAADIEIAEAMERQQAKDDAEVEVDAEGKVPSNSAADATG